MAFKAESWYGPVALLILTVLLATVTLDMVRALKAPCPVSVAPAAQANQPGPPGMYVRYPPQYAALSGQPTIFYEFYISNYTPPGLYRVEVLENGPAGKVLKTLEGDELKKSISPPASGISDYIVFMWVGLGAGDKPSSVYHKLYFNKSGSTETSTGGAVAVNYAAPAVISPPVRGANWLATEAPSNFNHHRTAIFTMQGNSGISERYAIDWFRYGPNGKVFRTDGKTNADYYCYGEELLAVADGTVVDVKDGLPDNAIGASPPPTIAWMGGNYVMLDIGNGIYAFYAHIIPGSIRVKVGDKVKTGDVLGRLGNSGNSNAPHLHFHIDDGMDGLFSEGVPYAFASYGLQDNTDWLAQSKTNESWAGGSGAPVRLTMTMPVNGDVVDFGTGNASTLVFKTAFEGGAKYTTANGKFPVLDLRGTYREMGRQYGYLMRDELSSFYNESLADSASRGMSYEKHSARANFMFEKSPERFKEILRGMSETSGLTLEQHKILNLASLDLTVSQQAANASTGCSGVAFWGDNSADGKLYFGRQWDSNLEIMGKYLKYFTVAVYHPTGSGNTVANLQYVGAVYTETAMNDKGIFLELDNGVQSDPTIDMGREPTLARLMEFMFDRSTMDEMDAAFNSTLGSQSYIVQVANDSVAYSYEWPTFGVRKRSENISGLLVAYNSFVPPYPASWAGKIPAPPDWDIRRNGALWLANTSTYKGKMDAGLMRRFLDTPYYEGGTFWEATVYQIAAVPGDSMLWIKGVNYSGWEQVDLKPFFGQAAAQPAATPGALFAQAAVLFDQGSLGEAYNLYNRSRQGYLAEGNATGAKLALGKMNGIRHILLEFSITNETSLMQQINSTIPNATKAQMDSWLDALYIVVDGQKRYFRSAVDDATFRNPELIRAQVQASGTLESLDALYEFAFNKSFQNYSGPPYLRPINYSATQWVNVPRSKLPANGTLRMWVALPVETDSQRNVKVVSITPAAYLKGEPVTTGEIGMAYFEIPLENLTTDLNITLKSTFTEYEQRFVIDPAKVGQYDKTGELYLKYTNSTENTIVSPEVRAVAMSLVGNETNPYLQAQKLYWYIVNNISYNFAPYITLGELRYPVSEFVRENGIGDCGAQSMYFSALARSIGIPARTTGGYQMIEGNGGNHFWAEFYLQNYGWVPVDVTMADSADQYYNLTDSRNMEFKRFFFASLDAKRYVIQKDVDAPLVPDPQERVFFPIVRQFPAALLDTDEDDTPGYILVCYGKDIRPA